MARKRIFLDECNSNLGHVFAPKDHVYTAKDFGITGKDDLKAIDVAVEGRRLTLLATVAFAGRENQIRRGPAPPAPLAIGRFFEGTRLTFSR